MDLTASADLWMAAKLAFAFGWSRTIRRELSNIAYCGAKYLVSVL